MSKSSRNNLPTMCTHHYSFDMQYDLGHQWVMTLGYSGTLSRNIYFHQNPNAIPAGHFGYAAEPADRRRRLLGR